MNKENIVLTASVKGTKSLGALLFNVDSEIISFLPLDTFTEFDHTIDYELWSSNRFVITKEFLNKILEADKVLVKISLRKRYVEETFTKNDKYKRFLELIETI